MKCEDVKFELVLFADAPASDGDATAVHEHLATCPVCRQLNAELQEVRVGLRKLSRPALPVNLVDTIQRSVREHSIPHTPVYGLLNPGSETRSFRLLFMSYTAGALASVALGFAFLVMILSSGIDSSGSGSMARRSSSAPVLMAGPADVYISQGRISPRDFANTRTDIAAMSPSVNPQGSLIDLTRSLVEGDLRDDEVVVVADVFENGSAQIAQVVEPSRNQNAVNELARALDYGASNTPFVPATLDQRSDTIRVIFKIQSVYVSTRERSRKSRSL
ncbi:MAG: zf-HC2 domain-containing protein [Acidobacteriota bacterium]